MIPLKHLSNFWRTLEMPLINCEQKTWSTKCIIVTGTANNQGPRFTISDTKRYVPVVTFLAEDNVKLLQ